MELFKHQNYCVIHTSHFMILFLPLAFSTHFISVKMMLSTIEETLRLVLVTNVVQVNSSHKGNPFTFLGKNSLTSPSER